LRNKQAPKRKYDAKCDHYDSNNRQTTWEVTPLQQSNNWRQYEAQEDRKRDGNQDFASGIQKGGYQGDEENRRNGTAGSRQILRSKRFQGMSHTNPQALRYRVAKALFVSG
jgi:hypothetical protein